MDVLTFRGISPLGKPLSHHLARAPDGHMAVVPSSMPAGPPSPSPSPSLPATDGSSYQSLSPAFWARIAHAETFGGRFDFCYTALYNPPVPTCAHHVITTSLVDASDFRDWFDRGLGLLSRFPLAPLGPETHPDDGRADSSKGIFWDSITSVVDNAYMAWADDSFVATIDAFDQLVVASSGGSSPGESGSTSLRTFYDGMTRLVDEDALRFVTRESWRHTKYLRRYVIQDLRFDTFADFQDALNRVNVPRTDTYWQCYSVASPHQRWTLATLRMVDDLSALYEKARAAPQSIERLVRKAMSSITRFVVDRLGRAFEFRQRLFEFALRAVASQHYVIDGHVSPFVSDCGARLRRLFLGTRWVAPAVSVGHTPVGFVPSLRSPRTSHDGCKAPKLILTQLHPEWT